MKEIGILVAEWFITGLIVYAGLSDKQILFINGTRQCLMALNQKFGFMISSEKMANLMIKKKLNL